MRGTDGWLYDLGTKGSGQTPYSRGADGRLTLKGGVREVLAAEALYQLGVRTSRCLSLIETGELLWRTDEPSPARAAVMVRLSRTHLRFGTFERLHYLQRPDLIRKLVDGAIAWYYPHLQGEPDCAARFYAELVERTAELAAQWMAAGFCHGVLNTDNMSVAGESFDYGPYAFIPTYNPNFTAAYFDHFRRYCYGAQPAICRLNLELLQQPLSAAAALSDLETGLARFDDCYALNYRQLMLARLGFSAGGSRDLPGGDRLVQATVHLLQDSQVPYHGFFAALAAGFNASWRDRADLVLENADLPQLQTRLGLWSQWQQLYRAALTALSPADLETVAQQIQARNPQTALLRPAIEAVWEPIAERDDWEPFYALLRTLRVHA
ncbi:hypothetical protein KR51_00025610 [Rubidibacter lacunae KORDI 51-2]|uniref:Protein adenylyltransferase SelO n=1 Tax=Rubidibacter lacunae KORDI 51-2 TaxID=582515 RepID=U5D8A7_9CHRO|nr:hypothetical protein KR51_00025610 [Rubidibacter lacunae KORDI 51-2]